MRKLLFFGLFISLVVSLAACNFQTEETLNEAELRAIHAMLQEANVGITAFVYDGTFTDYLAFEAQGSGVLYKEDGGYLYALTNYHVVNPRHFNHAEYYVQMRHQDEPILGELVAFDADLDLAVIRFKVDHNYYHLVNISTRVEDVLQVGEFVLSFGKPDDAEYFQGEYLGMVSIDAVNFDVVHHSTNVVSGHSGGALTDIHGNLVGINTWSSADNEGLAVSIHLIYDFLASNDLLP